MTTISTRFDARLSVEQKEFFEKARILGGFRTLTDFILYAAQQHASQIVEKQNVIIESKKDAEIFFKALMNPAEPTAKLKRAANRLKRVLDNK